jgi:hypothetical protein
VGTAGCGEWAARARAGRGGRAVATYILSLSKPMNTNTLCPSSL